MGVEFPLQLAAWMIVLSFLMAAGGLVWLLIVAVHEYVSGVRCRALRHGKVRHSRRPAWLHALVMLAFKMRTRVWQWRHRAITHTVVSTIAPRDTSFLSEVQRGPQPHVNTPEQAAAFRQRRIDADREAVAFIKSLERENGL
jgi:hypothetical protein